MKTNKWKLAYEGICETFPDSKKRYIFLLVTVFCLFARFFFEFGVVIGSFFLLKLKTSLFILFIFIVWQIVSLWIAKVYNKIDKTKETL